MTFKKYTYIHEFYNATCDVLMLHIADGIEHFIYRED